MTSDPAPTARDRAIRLLHAATYMIAVGPLIFVVVGCSVGLGAVCLCARFLYYGSWERALEGQRPMLATVAKKAHEWFVGAPDA